MAFSVAASQCKKICPEVLNWPGRLVGISEGAKQQNFKIKNSRPLSTPTFSSKMLVSRSEILVHLFQELQAVWWGITLVEIFCSVQFKAHIASHIFSVTKTNVTPGLMSSKNLMFCSRCQQGPYFDNFKTQLSFRMLTTSKLIFHIQPNMFKLLELTCSM